MLFSTHGLAIIALALLLALIPYKRIAGFY